MTIRVPVSTPNMLDMCIYLPETCREGHKKHLLIEAVRAGVWDQKRFNIALHDIFLVIQATLHLD